MGPASACSGGVAAPRRSYGSSGSSNRCSASETRNGQLNCGQQHGSASQRLKSWRRAPSVLVLLLALVAAWPGPSVAYGTEMSSTVALFRTIDLVSGEIMNNKNASRCVHMIDRAGIGSSSKINFLVTHYFKDTDGDYVPESFCYKPTKGPECVDFTQEAIDTWTNLFSKCVSYAVRLGYHISITPHLDDGLNKAQWRNAMVINPLMKYAGWSYYDIMMAPVAKALANSVQPTTRVWVALQGEMSAMVTKYPVEHRKMIPAVKQLIMAPRNLPASNIRLGVSTNFNKLCGMDPCTKAQVADPKQYNPAEVRKLYGVCDFIGMSAYPRYKYNLTDMEDTTQQLDVELRLFGIDLAKLVTVDGKELVLSEFGLGGGVAGSGDTPARTLQDAQSAPWFGVYGPYTRRLDPWRTYLPVNVISATRAYAQDWYAAASLWLKRKGGPTWRVDHAFLWNVNSWDLQGISLESTTVEGSYQDPVIVDTIRTHNLDVQGFKGYDNPGGMAPY